ncbi:MAG TPA: Holliday junction branch migration protein RuvA [Flammeovirgaceae bacterium]|nr:Holliday junction branch migration protein RuvA [Flammeovirgaceae bacterium]
MIAFIKGRLVHKEATHVVIDVGGVGYHIFVSLYTYSQIKDREDCLLYTYFHVKEDIQALYGFLNETDKQFFMDLISVSGIGPNTALVMQSSLTTDELKTAIVSEDVTTIQGIKGIGAKTAQRVILELKDKLKKQGISADTVDFSGKIDNNMREEALSALVMLGISKAAAQKSIDAVLRKSENNITLEELIKRALQPS